MNTIDWKDLKTYVGKQDKSFELLLYQLAYEEFGHLGTFTSIDDSGGGDGVEFYLTLPDGEIWGWQAKFFTGRLRDGGRKNQIKKSLHKSYKVHPSLSRFYLCIPFDLTPDEQEWFDQSLASSTIGGKKVLPDDAGVTKIPWTNTEIQRLLAKYPSTLRYFFDKHIPTFKDLATAFSSVADSTSEYGVKYIKDVHTIINYQKELEAHTDFKSVVNLIEKATEEYNVSEAILKVNESVEVVTTSRYFTIYTELFSHATKLGSRLKDVLRKLEDVRLSIIDLTIPTRSDVEAFVTFFSPLVEELVSVYRSYKEMKRGELMKGIIYSGSTEKEEVSIDEKERNEIIDHVLKPFMAIDDHIPNFYSWCLRYITLYTKPVGFLQGNAGLGKTHIAIDIVRKAIEKGNPAIFISGKCFSTDEPLLKQLRDILDIHSSLTVKEFFSCIDMLGKEHRVRVPIVIDGIHESTHWSTLWKRDLRSLVDFIENECSSVVLIITYRTSYEEQLFNDRPKSTYWLTDHTYDASIELIENYFGYYKIRIENRSYIPRILKHPLFLRLYCETKNRERKKTVTFSKLHEDPYDIFDEFIAKANKAICNKLKKRLPRSKNFLKKALISIGEYLWKNNVRGIPVDRLNFSEQEVGAIEDENILIFKDYNVRRQGEEYQITYDLLGGYCVVLFLAQDSLDSQEDWIDFTHSSDFESKILNKEHPLYDDVLQAVLHVALKEHGLFYWQLSNNELVFERGMKMIAEVEVKYLVDYGEDLKDKFASLLKDAIIKETVLEAILQVKFSQSHPLNFRFISDQLLEMNMIDRDLLWSEWLRKESDRFKSKPLYVELAELADSIRNDAQNRTNLVALFAMWSLTSTVLKNRFEATKILYWFGRKDPKSLVLLVQKSFSIDDIYVRERIMAALYGVVMAGYGIRASLEWAKKITSWLYEHMFKTEAKYCTSHIILRDYASQLISLVYSEGVSGLSEEMYSRTQRPFPLDLNRKWGWSVDRNVGDYYDGDAPIQMDFGNYMLGRILPQRQNYDYDNEEYKKAKGQILWRLYELGYELKKFSKIDRRIGNEKFRSAHVDDYATTERYGKKYCWIAYYELAGYRDDLGRLEGKHWPSNKRLTVDIDPSFPEYVDKSIDADSIFPLHHLMRDQYVSKEWLNTLPPKELLDHTSFTGSLGGSDKNEWFALTANVSDKKKNAEGGIIEYAVRTWMVLVSEEDHKLIEDIVDKWGDVEFVVGPGGALDHHYQGEIPWNVHEYEDDDPMKFAITYNHQSIIETDKSLEVYKDGVELSHKDVEKIMMKFVDDRPEDVEVVPNALSKISFFEDGMYAIPDVSLSNNFKDYLEQQGFQPVYKERTFKAKESEKLSFFAQDAFLSYDSGSPTELNQVGSSTFPISPILNSQNIRLKPQSNSLFKVNGDLFATSIGENEGEFDDYYVYASYIDAESLNAYAASNSLKVVWMQWYEKRFFEQGYSLSRENDKGEIVSHRVILNR